MIRFAKEKDIDNIMEFIDVYWKKGHILGNNKSFFKYEHLLEEGVSYVISENGEGIIEAILGYIPYGKSYRDVMTVMWKANHTARPSLGMELFNFLKENGDVRIIASPGSNKKLEGLYRYLGYQFGAMRHWYRLNSKKDNFFIAKVVDTTVLESKGTVDSSLFDSWEELDLNFDWERYKSSSPKPYKEKWYIKKRYFEHPIYKYIVYGIKNKTEKTELLLVFRKVEVNGSSVLRLLDCIGNYNLLEGIGTLLDRLMVEVDAEYIDCYEIGLDETIMISAGFLKTKETENIIPNYFAPFVQENIDIYYFSTDKDIVLFKGDGDQDRPN